MSSGNVPSKSEVNPLLNNVVNFGPKEQNLPPDAHDRIRQIIKKLQEISQRIDRLSSRY